MSIQYYQDNAAEFAENTLQVDMQTLYRPFLALLPAGGRILDAGCGAGRDAKAFARLGHKVDAFDASSELAVIASGHCGFDVQCTTFTGFNNLHLYGGIWACASLLHVPASEMSATFCHLARMLAADGVFYVSFKYGAGDMERGGRFFTNCDERRLQEFLHDSNLQVHSTWLTGDQREGRSDEQWLNALLVKADA